MRCRFVQPKITRLLLADGARHTLRELKAKTGKEKATHDQIAAVETRLAEYEQDGAFVEVKRELNAGEERNVFERMVKTMVAGEKMEFQPKQVGLAKMAEYILDWNLTDERDQGVVFSDAALLNLDGDTFNDIHAAIQAHEEVLAKEKDARKNVQSTASAS